VEFWSDPCGARWFRGLGLPHAWSHGMSKGEDCWRWPWGVIAKVILRVCQGVLTPASIGYQLSVFNKNPAHKDCHFRERSCCEPFWCSHSNKQSYESVDLKKLNLTHAKIGVIKNMFYAKGCLELIMHFWTLDCESRRMRPEASNLSFKRLRLWWSWVSVNWVSVNWVSLKWASLNSSRLRTAKCR